MILSDKSCLDIIYVQKQWVASLMAPQRIHLPMKEMQEMWVESLDGKDPLQEDMAKHSSILAWEITSTEEPGRL